MSLFGELKRRNVIRVGLAYAIVAWLVAQVLQLVFESFGAPDWAMKAVLVLLGAGLLFALLFAWAFELTPEGLKREKDVDRSRSIARQTGRKLDRAVIVSLGLVVAWFLFDEFYLEQRTAPAPEQQQASLPAQEAATPAALAPAETRHSVAVLPFRAMSSGEDDEYFADGLTEEILNYLAGLPELLVTARTSAFFFKDKDLPIPEVAARLGVAHVVEGSVRRAGERVRVTAQLIRASDGFHLWSQAYDRTLEDIFAVQEDIAANIAAKLDVVLSEDKLERMRRAGIGDVDAFIAYQKGMDFYARAHEVKDAAKLPVLIEANRWFDSALERVRDIVNALYLRTDLYGHKLFDHATNQQVYDEAELQQAQAEIRASLSRAIRAANNEQLRAILQAELDLFGNDWTAIPGYLDKAFGEGDCNPLNWITEVAVPFGWANQVFEHQVRTRLCDPLSPSPLMDLTRASIWAGQAERALEMVQQRFAEQGYEVWADDLRFQLTLELGRWADDPTIFGPTPEDSSYPMPRAIAAYAYTGQPEKARALFAEFEKQNPVNDYLRIRVAAITGDRETANRLAATIDGRTGGMLVLLSTVTRCFCGAPFDIDSAPNFKARIEEAGFPWPPSVPTMPPAKDR